MREFRKIIAVAVLLIGSSAALFGQYSVGMEAGGGYLLNSVEGAYTIDQITIPVMATFRYEFPSSERFAAGPLQVGIQTGWMRLYTATDEFGGYDYTANAFTIPVLAFGQAHFGSWFVRLGAGIHFWNVLFESDASGFDASELNESGLDPSAMVGAGRVFEVASRWAIEISVQGHIVGYETDSAVNDANTVNAMVGVVYDF